MDACDRPLLVYDLERTFVIRVPPKLQMGLRAVLAGTPWRGDIADWLGHEGLICDEPWSGRSDATKPALPPITDVSIDLAGSCNMACRYCFEDAIHSRLGKMGDSTIKATLGFIFNRISSGGRLVLHFGSGEPLLRFNALKRLMVRANEMAARRQIAISYELTTNATLVTSTIAKFLATQPINVRVSCDGPASLHDAFRVMSDGTSSHSHVTHGLSTLLDHLGDRITVNAVLSSRARLMEIWQWAKAMQLPRLHVIKVGSHDGAPAALKTEHAAFRNDLSNIADEMYADLLADRKPIDYQPLTKIIRRLMIPQPVTRFCGVAGSYLGVATDGRIYPCFRHLGLPQYEFGDVRADHLDEEGRHRFLRLEAADVDNRLVCQQCWGRYLCGGGCYADAVAFSKDRNKPPSRHCPFWLLEIEIALRLYDRLREEDPTALLKLFDPGGGDPLRFVHRANCS